MLVLLQVSSKNKSACVSRWINTFGGWMQILHASRMICRKNWTQVARIALKKSNLEVSLIVQNIWMFMFICTINAYLIHFAVI